MAKKQADHDGAELANRAIDTSTDDERAEIERQLEKLTPEQAAMFLEVLELTMRRRRIMLAGYAAALLAMILGMMWALYMYGTHEYGTFIGWVFLVPFVLVGLVLWVFGRWSRSVKPGQKPPEPRATASD